MGSLCYTPVAHFNGTLTQQLTITERLPWLYIIASFKNKLLYIGETFDDAGISGRLSSHFGRSLTSDFKKCAAKNAGIRNIYSPYLVIAARLPFDEDETPFNGESKKVRKACEAILHEIITTKFILPKKWTIISSSTSSLSENRDMFRACEEIYECFMASYRLFENLSSEITPFNFVLLDRIVTKKSDDNPNIGEIIEDIELLLFDWILEVLKSNFSDSWWTDGVNQPIRVNCAKRQEEEGEDNKVPKWAYMTLIDIKNIIENNWSLFSSAMEEVSGLQGKARATNWIKNINDKRKLWAHPLKQRFVVIDPSAISMVRTYQEKLRIAIRNDF